MKIVVYVFALCSLIIFQNIIIAAQEWRQIVPLVSNCEDVKRTLKIDQCKFPLTRHETSKYRLEVEFSEKDCNSKSDLNDEHWNVPRGTVLSVSIGLIEGIALKDYESDFGSYEIKEIPDLAGSLRYISKEKGVDLTVVNYAEEKVTNLADYLRDISKKKAVELAFLGSIAIQDVLLFPSTENREKFKCSCAK